MTQPLVVPVQPDYADYLHDESRKIGDAETISFPQTESDLLTVLSQVGLSGSSVTVQGGRTGLTAGAVPYGGHILNLSRMKFVSGLRETDGCFYLTVKAGTLLSELRQHIHTLDTPIFFPPDPTETSASIGGMVACNASGACSFHYGSTRDYIESLRVMLVDGDLLTLKRGSQKSSGRFFRLVTDSGRILEGTLPNYSFPNVKNAAGYFAADNMDLLDLFIGSDGTLGIISEIEIRLLPAPKFLWGLMAFFMAEEDAIRFVQAIRCDGKPVAIEFFNADVLDLLTAQRETNPAFSEIPNMPKDLRTAVYVEFHGDSEDVVSELLESATEKLLACGGDESNAWLADNAAELLRLKTFRHAVPEAVNLLIDQRRKIEPALTKLGTDMAAPDDKLETIFALYNRRLKECGLQSVIFGHIGNNHLHVNILPRSLDEYARGKELYLEWAREILKMGGTIAAEHGIGKLKSALLREMYGDDSIAQMRAVKKVFDPEGRLNPGNLF